MAEFLIRVHDKVNPDSPYLNVKCLKRGDVVSVCPDGWNWTALERSQPFWRIVAVPGMPMDEAQAFLDSEAGDRYVNRMLQPRAFKVDVDNTALPAAIKTWLADDTRAQPILTITLSRIRDLKTAKSPVPDPAVIG